MRLLTFITYYFRGCRNSSDTWTVTLNRPKALNALSSAVFVELNDALTAYDKDVETGAIVITGSDKAFAGMGVSSSVSLVHVAYCL